MSPTATLRGTALAADDDSWVRYLLAEILRVEGFQATLCADDAGALAEATLRAFDVFIFDRDMPGLSGPEVLARLRQRGVETPAVVISADQDRDPALLALLGPALFVRKPFEVREIRNALSAPFRRASAARESAARRCGIRAGESSPSRSTGWRTKEGV